MTNKTMLSGLAALALAGCAGPQSESGNVRANQAAVADCRGRADRTFLKQNPNYLYEQRSMDAPFSSTGVVGITSAGLGARYERDTMLDKCLAATRNGGGGNVPAGRATMDGATRLPASPDQGP